MVTTPLFGRTAALRAVLLTTGTTYVTYVLGLVVSVLIARTLGADQFGQYAYLVWLAGILMLLANNGITMTAIKFVSESMGRAAAGRAAYVHHWLGRIQLWSIALVGAALVVLFPVVRPAGWHGSSAVIIVLVLVSFAFKAEGLFNTSIAKGYGRFSIEPATNTLVTVASFLGVVALTLYGATLLGYAVLFAVSSVGYALVSQVLLHRAGVVPVRDAALDELLVRVRPHLFWTAAIAAIAAIGNRSVEMFLVNRWLGAAQAGYFAISTALTRAGIDLLVSGLSSIMMPVMGYVLGSGDRQRAQRVFGDACRYYQFMGLAIAGVGVCWAEVGVHLLYGAQYAGVVPIFRIMIIASGVLLANGAFSAVLGSSDNQRFRVGVTIASLVTTVVVASALIPVYGVVGAALAQATSSVLSAAIVVYGIRRFVGLKLPWAALLRQYLLFAALAIGAYAVIWLSGGDPVAQWLAGLGFGLAFGLLSLPAGLWRDDERVHAASLLERYPQLRWLARSIAPAQAPDH